MTRSLNVVPKAFEVVGRVGIEPTSGVLQTPAMTTSANVPEKSRQKWSDDVLPDQGGLRQEAWRNRTPSFFTQKKCNHILHSGFVPLERIELSQPEGSSFTDWWAHHTAQQRHNLTHAEEERFELSVPFRGTPVFEAGTAHRLRRSSISPLTLPCITAHLHRSTPIRIAVSNHRGLSFRGMSKDGAQGGARTHVSCFSNRCYTISATWAKDIDKNCGDVLQVSDVITAAFEVCRGGGI